MKLRSIIIGLLLAACLLGAGYWLFNQLQNDQPVTFSQSIANNMLEIPGGDFVMGCAEQDRDCWKEEHPSHTVSIKPFKLLATEVTWSMYQPCIDAGACPDNLAEGADEGWGKANRPVINVSLYDIAEYYIPWLNQQTGKSYRLPTEAEWEYAARAGSTTAFSWGKQDDCSKARYGYFSDQCGKQKSTDPVKSYAPNAFGLYDMHGNVYEWTVDCWNPNYQGAPSDGSAWLTGDCSRRVLRGGSWYVNDRSTRASARFAVMVRKRDDIQGFRLAHD